MTRSASEETWDAARIGSSALLVGTGLVLWLLG
jgi:hypothetical protein